MKGAILIIILLLTNTVFGCNDQLLYKHSPSTDAFVEIQTISKLSSNNSIYGKWIVKSYRFGDAPAAFSDEEAQRYLNKKVILSSDIAIMFDDTCHSLNYSYKIEDKDYFLYNACKQRSSLSINEDSIVVHHLNCLSPPIYVNEDSLNFSSTILQISETSIIIPTNGVFFYLNKEKERELSFKGKDDFIKKIKLNTRDAILTIEYDFHKIPDQLIIKDEFDHVLFNTKMEVTESVIKKLINITLNKNVPKHIYLSINSSQKEKSNWNVKMKISDY